MKMGQAQDVIETYTEVKPLITKLARQWPSFEVDDLIGEGSLVFLHLFDQQPHSLKQRLVVSLKSHFYRLYRHEAQQRQLEYAYGTQKTTTTTPSCLLELIDSLNTDCQTIVDIIFGDKLVVQSLIGLRAHLRGIGWGRDRIRRSINQIKKCLHEAL